MYGYYSKIDGYVRQKVGDFIGPVSDEQRASATCRGLGDREELEFLYERVDKCSGNSGRVCTCDDNNHALRKFQKAQEAADQLIEYRGQYRRYTDRGSDYPLWSHDENNDWGTNNDPCLDDFCNELEMRAVGTQGKYSSYPYHDLRSSVDNLESCYEDYFDGQERLEDELVIQMIVEEHLQPIINKALEEQLDNL